MDLDGGRHRWNYQWAKDSDGGATSEQESSSSRLISVEDSFDIVGGGPWTGASPTRVVDSSERSSEPIDGTVAAESGEQEADSQGRSRTPVVWGQGIPLRPAMTIRRTTPKLVDKAAQTTSQVLGVHTSILSNILPGHASVTDAVTRLQRERDHHKKELKKNDDDYHKRVQSHKDQHQDQLRTATNATAQYKMQFEQAMPLIQTQKLSIKLLQDELGEEAEFDAEETAQMRSVQRECERRVNNYEDRVIQLESDMQKDIDKQVSLLKKVTKERDDARNEVKESQQSAMNMFNEQKRHESQIDEVSCSNKVVD